jgi:hypothetical protein
LVSALRPMHSPRDRSPSKRSYSEKIQREAPVRLLVSAKLTAQCSLGRAGSPFARREKYQGENTLPTKMITTSECCSSSLVASKYHHW